MKININSKLLPFFPAIAVGTIVLLIVLVGGLFLYQKNKPQKITTEQTIDKLIEEVGKLIELPSGETPTLATITDVSKLKDQPFFARAKNGDKVLIYSASKKAILYDPVAKKVIDVAPINLGSPSAQINPN